MVYGIAKFGLSRRPWRLYVASCLAFHQTAASFCCCSFILFWYIIWYTL